MKNGFTLLEVVVSTLLVALLVLVSTLALAPMIEAMTNVRRNSDGAQKLHLATSRLVREFTTITNVVNGTGNTLTYDFLDQNRVGRRHTVTWTGNAGAPLLLENAVLLDDVGSFILRYRTHADASPQSTWSSSSREIEVVISLASMPGAFTNRVRPRNVPGG